MDWLNYATLAVYILVIVGISVYTRNKNSSTKDFLLAGRGMGSWMSAFAYGTAYFSSVIFIGYAGRFGWNYGTAAIWIGIGNAAIGSYLGWKLLAKRTRNITNLLGAQTMPEFFEKRYLNKHLKLLSAIIIFIFTLPYTASVYQGLAYTFEMVFRIDFVWCIVIMAVLTAVYVFFGGYLGTTLTNFFQAIVMLVGVAVMVIVFMVQPEVNFLQGFTSLAEKGLGIIPGSGSGSLLDAPWFNLLIIVLLTSFGVLGLPQIIHKFYTVKNDGAIKKAAVISTVFCAIIGFGTYFVGSLGSLFFDQLPAGGYDYIVPILLQRIMPAGLLGLIVVLLLAASMSTLSGLTMTGASSVAVDIYKGYVKKDADDAKVKKILKILCLVFVLISAVLAYFELDAIVTLMSLSWGTLAGCFLGPYIYGIFSKKITSAGVFASLIGGVVTTVALVIVFGALYPAAGLTGFTAIIKGGIGKSPLIGVIAMIQSMIITPLVSRFTKAPDKAEVDKMFANITKEIE